MPLPAALLSGKVLRLALVGGVVGYIYLTADFGSIADGIAGFGESIIYEIEQFITNSINPF